MNHSSNFNMRTDPNGDLTLSNDDGSITIRHDGTIVIATVASIELVGASLGKLDVVATAGTSLATSVRGVLNLLLNRGKKP